MTPCPFCGKPECEGLCQFAPDATQTNHRKMTPAQYADFMAKHAPAGKRTQKRKEFFSGDK